MSSLSSSSSLSPSSSSSSVPLLPTTARPPSIKLLSLKKRPQSVVSLSPLPSPFQKTKIYDAEHQKQKRRTMTMTMTTTQKVNVQNSTSSTTSSGVGVDVHMPVWIVGDSTDCLLTLPLFHVSPMTHLVLKSGNGSGSNGGSSNSSSSTIESYNNVSPNRIASRIVQCIRSMDATCDYNSERGCATVQTRDHVVLLIQLLKTPDSQNIIVEVERKRGDIIKFHSAATAILNSIRSLITKTVDSSGDYDNEHENESSGASTVTAATSATCTRSTIVPDESNVLKFEEAMDKICTLLKKDRLDAVLLGMESLSFLTDGKSSNEEVTYQAVNAVLQDDGGEWQVATDVLLRYLGCSDLDLDLDCDLDEHHENVTLFTTLIGGEKSKKTAMSNHEDQIKHLALKIFTNCFTYMANKYSKDMLAIVGDKILSSRMKDILLLLAEQIHFNDDDHRNDTFQDLCKSLL